MQSYPYPEYDGVRSIVLGIVVSILTCGIYYFSRSDWDEHPSDGDD